MQEIVVAICCLLGLILICYGLYRTIYKLVMGEFFLAFNDTHRIAYKRGRFYPQHRHSWNRFWHHYKNTHIYKDEDGEWQTLNYGKLSFKTSEEARKFLGNLAWYN